MKENKSLLINVKGKLIDLSSPAVMGILNVTPDSFYEGSRKQGDEEIENRVKEIINQGGDIIDIGAYSSRPNAENISPEEEIKRLRKGLSIIKSVAPNAIVSVDTFRAEVARMAVEEYGVDMINDIAAGELDEKMFDTVAELNVPYIMMHMKGTPQNMQIAPHYDNIMKEVFMYFAEKIDILREKGVKDIIIDPGFGFAKTIEHNYKLMANMQEFQVFGLPILVGVSRKSMIYKYLETSPAEALNGTTALNTVSLMKGANILRVHDVKEAVETVKIISKMRKEE